MNNKHICHLGDRNYYLPNGRKACAFVDVDDTIIKCGPLFIEAKSDFGYFMSTLGFNKVDAVELLEKYDLENIANHGFEIHRLADSMRNVYRQLCDNDPERIQPEALRICDNIGRSPFFRDPEIFPNAIRVLNRIHRNFHLTIVTIGNYGAQKFKVSEIGRSLFDEVIITSGDDKAELVRAAMDAYEADPNHSFMIGDSKKSDGQCLKYTNFILMLREDGWAYNQADLPQNTGFKTTEVKNWREAEEKAIKPMLWIRKYQLGDRHCSTDTQLSDFADSSDE